MAIIDELEQFSEGIPYGNRVGTEQTQADNNLRSMAKYNLLADAIGTRGKAAGMAADLRNDQTKRARLDEDEDRFNAFSDGLQGIDPNDDDAVGNYINKSLTKDPRLANMDEVKDYMSGLSKGREMKTAAKKEKLEQRNLDEDDAQWEERAKLNRDKQKLQLAQTEQSYNEIGTSMEEGRNITLTDLHQQLGASDLNPETRSAVAGLAGTLQKPEDMPKLKQLSALLAGAASFSHLEQSVSSENDENSQILNYLQQKGLLDKGDEAIRKHLGPGIKKLKAYEQAASSIGRLSAAKKAREEVQAYIPIAVGKLKEARESGNKDAFDSEMSILGEKVMGIKGMIDKNLKTQKSNLELRDQNFKTRKAIQSMQLAQTKEDRLRAAEQAKPFIRNEAAAKSMIQTMIKEGDLKKGSDEDDKKFTLRLARTYKDLTSHLNKDVYGGVAPAGGGGIDPLKE